jgi:nucleoid-associated protein YgaU
VIENQTAPRLIPSLAESESSLLTGSDLPQSRHDFAQIPIRLNTGIALQAKLALNKPGDEYEQEADRVAEQVMRMPEPQLLRPGTPNTMSTFSGPQLAPAISSPRTTSPGVSGHPMHRLHRSAGNSAVSGVIQRKLQIGAPDTPEEREADRVAEQIMRMPDGAGPVAIGSSASVLHRKCAACSEEEEEIHRSATGAGPGTAPPIVNEVLSQPGQPLPKSTRDFFEPRLGADLSGVRIHTDNQAALSAEAIGARAYTMGSHIAFGSGEMPSGLLLAHELAHVSTQSEAGAVLHRQATADAQKEKNDPRGCGVGTENPDCTPCFPETKDGKRICGPPSSNVTFSEPCTALPRRLALLLQEKLMKYFPLFMAAATRCFDVRHVWFSYLSGSSKAYSFNESDCVGVSAKKDPKGAQMAAEAAQKAFNAVKNRLPALLPADNGQSHNLVVGTLSLSDALGIKGKDPLTHPEIEYKGIPWNAAAVLAGGVGKNGLGSDIFGDDDRELGGTVTISILPTDRQTGTRQVSLRYEPTIYVKDTVDFCPGNLGAGFPGQQAAITLSRLEASGVARDVPIEIRYKLDELTETQFILPNQTPGPKPAPVPEPTPTPSPAPQRLPTEWIVQPGDYLIKIAERFYADGDQWSRIYDANRGVIGTNPNLIIPGQRLVIPE